MSNPWAGQLAKNITSKKRSRLFWNVFFSILILGVVFAMSCFVYQVVAERCTYDSEQIFIEYKNEWLTTDVSSFKIPESDKQEIKISNLTKIVNSGETITMTVSSVSGELLEVKFQDDKVYKRQLTPIMPTVVVSIVLVIPMLAFMIFMLVVTNIKHPSKRIDKIQRQFLLRFYK